MTTMKPRRPTAAELRAAIGRRVPDVIAPGLQVLFCGINPSLYSAAVGHHFARPGNRFWTALHRADFTDRILAPWEDQLLLEWGCGLTNLVERATARADEVRPAELIAGRRRLERKVRRYAPRWVAVVGVGAYRLAFDRPRASVGPQEERIGAAGVWLLPNPSGLNANYKPADFARVFRMLREAALGPGALRRQPADRAGRQRAVR